MRITNNMLISNMMYSLNTNLSRMSKIQSQLSTGKKINIPSDDPLIASRSLKFRSDIAEIEQHLKNIDDGLSWTEVTDSSLNTIGEVIKKARELAVQASSDTYSSSERNNMKEEVTQLYNQLINLSNTTYAGRNIFSGYKTDKPLITDSDQTYNYTDLPVVTDGTNFRLGHNNIGAMVNVQGFVGGVSTVFTPATIPGTPGINEYDVDLATGQLVFNGAQIPDMTNVTASYTLDRQAGDYNPDVYSFSNISQTTPMQGEDIKFEVGVGDMITVNVIGTNIFGNAGVGNVGNHIQNFKDFIAALQNNDHSGISNTIEDLDTFLNSVLEQRANVGARSNRFDLTSNRLEDQLINLTELMSKNEDADIAEVIMKLKSEENVYMASLDIGARIIQPTLLNYLR